MIQKGRVQSMSSWSVLLRKFPPELHIGRKWCPRMSILECSVIRKRLNHISRHIRICLRSLSRNLEIDMKALILEFLALNIVNFHSRLTSLFSLNPLSREMIRHPPWECNKIPIGRGSNEGLVRHERIPTSKLWNVFLRNSLWVGSNKTIWANLKERLAYSNWLNKNVNGIHHNKSGVSNSSYTSSVSQIENNSIVHMSLEMF